MPPNADVVDVNIPLRRDGSREWIQRFLQDLLVLPGRLCEMVFQQRLGPARPGSSKSPTRRTARPKDSQLVTASMRTASSSGVHLEFSFNRLSPKVVDMDGEADRLEERGGGGVGDGGLSGALGQGEEPYIYAVRGIRDGEEYGPPRAVFLE